MREAAFAKKVRLLICRLGGRCFSNPIAKAWVGKFVRSNEHGVLLAPGAHPVDFGLVKDSPDCVGWYPLKVRQEHVGQTIQVWVGLETKAGKNGMTEGQKRFYVVETAGGTAAAVVGCVRTEEEVMEIIDKLEGRNGQSN